MNIRYDFSGKCVVVTGGAQGIGLKIATDFLDAGARVAIWDWSQESLQAAQASLDRHAENVVFQRLDISNHTACTDAANALPFAVDILVNNAGITRDKSMAKMSFEDFATVVAVNLTGGFNVTKALLEKFNPVSQHKRVINMASVVALYGNFGQTNYAAAKAGVVGMTRTLARELGRKGFTVNAIAPGFTLTAMVEAMPPEVLKQIAGRVPTGRLGTTHDISASCLFLASDEASYVNGAVLSVDGGLVC